MGSRQPASSLKTAAGKVSSFSMRTLIGPAQAAPQRKMKITRIGTGWTVHLTWRFTYRPFRQGPGRLLLRGDANHVGIYESGLPQHMARPRPPLKCRFCCRILRSSSDKCSPRQTLTLSSGRCSMRITRPRYVVHRTCLCRTLGWLSPRKTSGPCWSMLERSARGWVNVLGSYGRFTSSVLLMLDHSCLMLSSFCSPHSCLLAI